MISSCVEQDKAGDFIAELYNKQGKWANSDSHSGLKEIALSNGVSSNEFYSCIENESLAENIKKARNEGAKKYKIKSTPTFVINGEKLESVSSAEDLITAVQDKQEGKSANDTLKKRAQEVLSLGDNDKILGDESAPITIVEYASLSCPHCANFHEKILPQLKSDMINTGKAKLVFRHFPLNAPALDAAIIAECADKKDFYKYIGEFYKQQKSWAFEKDYKSKLMEISGKLGMSSEVFDKCLQNKELKDKIIEEVSKASQKLGVSSTPTFFINGEKAGGVHSAEEFKAEITKATK
jgi:protein-disulfide isomerase